MNILINFRYLSSKGVKDEIVDEVSLSEEIDEMTEKFKQIALEYKNLHIKANEFYDSNKIHLDAKELIRKSAESCLAEFNSNEDYNCYLWIDEICSIYVNGIKAIPLEDSNEYVNFSDVKHTIQESIFELIEKDKSINPVTYSEVFFVIYLDIIERKIPFFKRVVQI